MNIRRFIGRLSKESWNIGFIDNSMGEIIDGASLHVHLLKHKCEGSWFADPFVLDVTGDDIFLLVEEWQKDKRKGRISKLVVDRKKFYLKSIVPILELETHVSFPAIYRTGDCVFIYPESKNSRGLICYQYNNDVCTDAGVMCDDILADAVCSDLFGERLLFATREPYVNGKVLSIYSFDENCGKYLLKDTFSFKENIARMAGSFFCYNGKIYRPAQESNHCYGHSVILQEVLYDDGKWTFRNVRRMKSSCPEMEDGMHTFNSYKGVIVTDARRCNFLKKIREYIYFARSPAL